MSSVGDLTKAQEDRRDEIMRTAEKLRQNAIDEHKMHMEERQEELNQQRKVQAEEMEARMAKIQERKEEFVAERAARMAAPLKKK